MASSGKSSQADPAALAGAFLRQRARPGAHVTVGLSGGADSMALLHALALAARAFPVSLRAVHVHHGISPNADRWAAFCERQCAALGVPFELHRVDISPHRHLGLEGAAREARWRVFRAAAPEYLALAHHRDDQAETVLLQMLRGAGVKGMAAMPAFMEGFGQAGRPIVIRPFLELGRDALRAWAHGRGIEWIEDESNGDRDRLRNFLRLEVIPRLDAEVPAASAVLARSAGHLGEAAGLLDELGREDLERIAEGDELDIAGLRALGAPRARNALRVWCAQAGAPVPSARRLEELMRQMSAARGDANICLQVAGWTFRRYRGLLYLEPPGASPGDGWSARWSGDNRMLLLELGGTLHFRPQEGRGLDVGLLRSGEVMVRLRRGGESMRTAAGGHHRSLRNLFQETGMPPWRRERLPLVFLDGKLAAVPGLGEHADLRAGPGRAGLIVSWEPLGAGLR
jgi:tRNA(Ile)-lysidine synthase